jgi:hypothetical protein
MSNRPSKSSELHPPDNITPSTGTVFSALAVLLPITLLFLGLFTGVLNP